MSDSLRIAVVSDTHMWAKDVIAHLQTQACDELIFLGDKAIDGDEIAEALQFPALVLTGNCDFTDARESEAVLNRQGHTLFCTHGHNYSVKHTLMALEYRAKEVEADIVLFGHTHLPHHEERDGIHFLNPGSAALPEGGNKASYAVLTLSPNLIQVEFVYLS